MPLATDIIVAVGDALHRKKFSTGDGDKTDDDPEVAILERLVSESDKARSDRGSGDAALSFVDMAARNAARFLGDHTSSFSGSSIQSKLQEEGFKLPADNPNDTGVIKAVLNRTQTSTLATHAAMTERPIQVSVDPVESDDRWLYVMKQRAVRRLALLMQNPAFVAQINPGVPLGQRQITGFTSQELAGEAFIDDARAEWLMSTLRNPQTGEPLLDDNDFHIANDTTTARAGKRLYDNRWDLSDGDAAVREHALYMRVFGFQPIFFQWDQYTQRFWIENPHGMSVHPDPTHARIGQFDYLVWDYRLSLDKAQAMYPKVRSQLKRAASEGKMKPESQRVVPTNYGQHDYERPMVLVRTGWIKNAKVPMTEDEALQQEAVRIEETGVGPPSYIHARTGEVVVPPSPENHAGSDNWPKTFGILQVQVLPQIGKTIDKRRCPYVTEPFGWTVNIPTFHKPWGIGDPYRLESVQMAINREITVLTTHSRYHAYPVEFWPADLWEDLRKRGFKLQIRPGRVIPIPRRMYDQILQRGGKFGITQEPPALPRDRVSLLQVLLAEHDRMSGHVEALQGRTQGAQTSGRTVQQLRQEARGPLGIQARNLEDTMTRIARLGMDAMVKWMRKPVAYEILNAYPPFMVDEFLKRLALGRYNVTVSATMGRGILQQMDREESQQLYGLGVMDRTTLLEDHSRDPGTILRRRRQDLEEDAAAQGVMELQAQHRAAGNAQQAGVSAPGGTPSGGPVPSRPFDPATSAGSIQ